MNLRPPTEREQEFAKDAHPEVAAALADQNSVTPDTNSVGGQTLTPVAREWQALEATAGAPALYRAAGDHYLDDAGDVRSAVRCYCQLLDAEGDEETTIRAEDSWLLMALKEAKQREKRYAKNDG